MIKLGDYNNLKINRFSEIGAYLDAGDMDEILMPNKYLSPDMQVGDEVTVFVYLDQQERLVATTEVPLARVGDFAFLEVSWTNQYGAFLNWGVLKDLFVPFREQKQPMERGRSYIVHVGIDIETHRIVGTAKVERYFREATPQTHHRGQEVEILVWQKNDIGLRVIVDNAYAGIVYDNQIFGDVPHTGDRLTGTVVNVRPDGRLDISISRIGKSRFRDFADQLLDELQKAEGGFLPYSDGSSSEEIGARFGVSKKTFKRAIGTLYKQQRITLSDNGIKLNARPQQRRNDRKPRNTRHQ